MSEQDLTRVEFTNSSISDVMPGREDDLGLALSRLEVLYKRVGDIGIELADMVFEIDSIKTSITSAIGGAAVGSAEVIDISVNRAEPKADTCEWWTRIIEPDNGGDNLIEPSINLTIVDGTKIKRDNAEVDLNEKDELVFLFNALISMRQKEDISAKDFHEIGFCKEDMSDVSNRKRFAFCMNSLIEKLNQNFDEKIILKTGEKRWRRYKVNPRLKLNFANDEPPVLESPPEINSLTPIRKIKPRFNIRHEPLTDKEARQNSDRVDRIYDELISCYGQHPEVDRMVSRQRNGSKVTVGTDNPFKLYLQEIGQYKLLTEGQEKILSKMMRAGINTYDKVGQEGRDWLTPEEEKILIKSVAAHQTVYLCNLRLVVSVAKKFFGFANAGLDKLDMIDEGNIGLLRGIRRFDPAKGVKISSYCVDWINQATTRGVADKIRAIRLPVHKNGEYSKIRKAIGSLEVELERRPSSEEIANAVDMDIEKVEELMVAGSIDLKSINQPVSVDSDTEVGEIMVDYSFLEVEEDFINAISSKKELYAAIGQADLSEDQLAILSLRYEVAAMDADSLAHYQSRLLEMGKNGLSAEPTHVNIGKLLGLSRARVGQLEDEALRKLEGVVSNPQAHFDPTLQ